MGIRMDYLTRHPQSELALRLFLSALAQAIDSLDEHSTASIRKTEFMRSLDRAIAVVLVPEDTDSGTAEVVGKLRRTIDEAISDMNMFARPPH